MDAAEPEHDDLRPHAAERPAPPRDGALSDAPPRDDLPADGPRSDDPRPIDGRPDEPPRAAPPSPAVPTASLADGVERAASPRHVTVERLAGAFLGAALVVGAGLGALVLELVVDGPLAWLGRGLVVAALGLAALLQWWPGVQHRHLRWRLDAAALRIRRGVLWRTEIDVPRVRVQHTDVVQGPLERRFGLARLVVHTAGTVDATVELPGLDLATARAVRGHLVGGGDDGAV